MLNINIETDTLYTINKMVSNAFIFILLPICIYFLSHIFWNWYYPPTTETLPKISSSQTKQELDIVAQASWNWFQIKQSVKKAVTPISKINAKLMGVIGIDQKGIAMIRLDNSQTEIFKVGEVIKEGIVLDRLGIDYVVLLREEEEELLRMKKANVFTDSEEEVEKVNQANQKYQSATAIKRLSKIIKKEPLKLMEIIKFQQIRVKRHGLGYKVSPKSRSQKDTFNAIGFRSGDVIFTINNKAIVQLATSPQTVTQLLKADQLNIKLLRGGKIEDVTISLK